LSAFKSRQLDQLGINTNTNTEEKELSKAVTAHISDLVTLKDNLITLNVKKGTIERILREENKNSSLLDDFADPSQEMPSYIDPED